MRKVVPLFFGAAFFLVAKGLPFAALDENLKSCIIDELRGSDHNLDFLVTYESLSGYRWYKDETFLQAASRFGLTRANCVLSSSRRCAPMTNGMSRCYIYESDTLLRFGKSDYGHMSYFYAPIHNDCVCRLVFVKPQNIPLKDHFRPFGVESNGKKKVVGFDAVWDYEIAPGVKLVDKPVFLSTFSNNVYKITGCAFAVKKEIALETVRHDYRKGQANVGMEHNVREVPRFGDIAVLDRREISEVVYWLWQRKGNTGEYDAFVEDHPELFEPISGPGDFTTELGKRLLGTWE